MGLQRRLSDVSSFTPPVFFIIGCQRSGSNWLRTILGEREDLFAPHPPHIMRDFLPNLSKFGDLDRDANNLKILVDHVCTFVEKNQVQWQDKHGRAIKFDRKSIYKGASISIDCLKSSTAFEQLAVASKKRCKYRTKKLNITTPNVPLTISIDRKYYLLAIFDEIMQAGAKANHKNIWVCKSMGMSQHHEMLINFYGKERLRYIYLVRDPRDVCLSFMKTPVGDCHPYAISKKWVKLQRHALRIISSVPDLVHRVSYEDILHNQQKEIEQINIFMGARSPCKSMRRGSVIQLKEISQICSSAKEGRASVQASRLSAQFKNLTRGDSFKKEQFQKWANAMREEDMLIVESCCLDEMRFLGYDTHLVGKGKEILDFSDHTVSQYAKENRELVEEMMRDLREHNPADFARRDAQSTVLSAPAQFLSPSFSKMDIDPYASDDDTEADDESSGKFPAFESGLFKWPIYAGNFGFLSDEEVEQRFDLQQTRTTKLGRKKGGIVLTYAAATQRAYYPSRANTMNQDIFHAGPCSPTYLKKNGINSSYCLFAVFDGHGAYGDACADLTRNVIKNEIISWDARMSSSMVSKKSAENLSTTETSHCSEPSRYINSNHNTICKNVPEGLKKAYNEANDCLAKGFNAIDASASGTTAVSLVIDDDGLVHIVNTGDSRCLIVSKIAGCNHITVCTNEHTLENINEVTRIEKSGGLVMTSEQYDVMDKSILSFESKRVWSSEGKFPGCAFSRSIGDTRAKNLGVIADPEIIEHHVPRGEDELFILGSDGIFDFISNEEVVDIATKCNDPSDACRAIVGLAYRRWIHEEGRTDDMTVIVGRIAHAPPNAFWFRSPFPRWKCKIKYGKERGTD